MLATDASARMACDIIDANRYLVLATADRSGLPWSSPVYFAHAGYREFFWISSPEATHSLNIAARPQVGIAIFDSQAPISTGQGVYMFGVADRLDCGDITHGIDVFSRRSLTHGGAAWTGRDVDTDADLRLYRATVDAHWILAKDGKPDHRIPVQPA